MRTSQTPLSLGRIRRLLPGPRRTPFTFGYAVVLACTSLFAGYADPHLLDVVLRGSSTDVAHLVHAPVLVLVASALWIAGGVTSPYAMGFLFVLTALEHRVGGRRTAGVFLLGHGLATLLTELPVGLWVLADRLPESSLHRLDYGISFGVTTCVGALAGLLPRWPKWLLLGGTGAFLLDDLLALTDPLTNWGHALSLFIGVATWPLLRTRAATPAAGTRCAAQAVTADGAAGSESRGCPGSRAATPCGAARRP